MTRLGSAAKGLAVAALLARSVYAQEPVDPVVITNQPQSVTVLPCAAATFSVVVGGSTPIAFQWYRDGEPIGLARSESHTVVRPILEDDNAQFFVVITNAFGAVTSATATLHVSADVLPPRLVAAAGKADPTQILLTFDSCPGLDPSSAENPLHYAVSGGIEIIAARLTYGYYRLGTNGYSGIGTEVFLTTATPLSSGATYTVAVTNVMDTLGNRIDPNASSASFRAWVFSPGFLRMDVFSNDCLGVIACGPWNDSRYPDSPAVRFLLSHADSRDAYPNDNDPRYPNFYARMWGYFAPEITTNHIFYVRGSAAFLSLSTDESQSNEHRIAEEPGCCNVFTAHASSPQPLVAGHRYFLELIYFYSWGIGSGQASTDGENVIPDRFLGVYADPAGASVTITRQPATESYSLANQPVSLSIEARGSTGEASNAPVSFQWQHSALGDAFTNIPGATGSNYSFIAPGISGCQFATNYYRAIVFTPGAGATSQTAMLTVPGDVAPPRLLCAKRDQRLDSVVLSFVSCPLDSLSATQVSHYLISGGVSVISANLVNSTNVVLTTSPLADAEVYTVTVRDVADETGNVIDPNPSTVSFRAWSLRNGSLRCQYYFNLIGNYVPDLTNSPAFPDLPDQVAYLNSFELPQNIGGNFGARLSGYLIPPVTGNYNFFIAADSAAQLYLSTDAQPANKVFLCEDPVWSAWRDWTGQGAFEGSHDRRPNQSHGIPLVAGQRYFIEALTKGSSPYSHCGVAWQLPGAPIPTNGSPPIAGEYLAALAEPVLRLNARASNGVAVLSWPAGGVLQLTTNLPPQWADWPDAPNPVVISNGPTRFFRVRFDP